MDEEFKIPTFDAKLKTVAKKPTPQTDSVEESKEQSTVRSEVSAKPEAESGKVESDLPKNVLKCPYVEPKWSSQPEPNLVYSFEVLKGGQIVENVSNLQNKAFWTIGKLPNNDIVMAHPTISRFHAVLQYRPEVASNDNNSDSSDDEDESNSNGQQATTQKPKIDKGWYLYDLNSTHGSFVNKMKVPPKTYIRLRVGYMLKFGASTRNYILQGPGFDEEAESELTITEMKELRLKKQQEAQEKLMEEEKRKEAEGVSWGMAEDAEEETDLSHNPFASTNNEELFLQDPKKTLRGFFEREGLNLDYKVDELSNGTYLCRIELPITDSVGRSIVAEFTHKGKKKECVLQCALEACRILDRNGLLRQANHEPRKRKVESSDDDDDEFYDRTTEAEEKRRRKAGAEESVTLSYEQLLDEEKKLQTQLTETEQRIERYQMMEKESKEKEAMDVDDLDDFMSGLSSEKKMDKAEVRKCRFELLRIKADIQKVKKLINIARPIELPPLRQIDQTASDASQTKKKINLPLFGKKKTFGFDKLKMQVSNQSKGDPSAENSTEQAEPVEEFDDDNNEDTKSAIKTNEDESKVKPKHSSLKTIDEKDCDAQTTSDSITSVSNKSAATTEATSAEEKEIKSPKFKEEVTKNTEKAKPNAPNNEKSSHSSARIDSKNIATQETVDEESTTQQNANAGSSNKNRNKNRHRGNKMRYQVDIDETEEDTTPQKYSGWMPPENQTGDGMTDLNSKYGY